MNYNISANISPLELFQNVLKSHWSGLSNAFGISSNGDLLAELRQLLVDDPTRIFLKKKFMMDKTQNSNKFNELCTPKNDRISTNMSPLELIKTFWKATSRGFLTRLESDSTDSY